jgi:hypothetical protein
MTLDMSPLASTLIREITDRPQQFHELVDAHREVPWPDFLRAWGGAASCRDPQAGRGRQLLNSRGKCGGLIPSAHVGIGPCSKWSASARFMGIACRVA